MASWESRRLAVTLCRRSGIKTKPWPLGHTKLMGGRRAKPDYPHDERSEAEATAGGLTQGRTPRLRTVRRGSQGTCSLPRLISGGSRAFRTVGQAVGQASGRTARRPPIHRRLSPSERVGYEEVDSLPYQERVCKDVSPDQENRRFQKRHAKRHSKRQAAPWVQTVLVNGMYSAIGVD